MSYQGRGKRLPVWDAARERELVDAVRAGCPAAYTEVYEALFDPLCEFADRVVRSPDLAQDAVQDVFGRLWKNRDRWIVRDTIAACLHRAVRNRARDLLRRERRKHPPSLASLPVSHTPTPDEHLDASELRKAVQEGLLVLSPRGLDVFLLSLRGGLTYEEIGDLLGIARNTVRVNLIESRRRLHRELFRRGFLDEEEEKDSTDSPGNRA